MTTPYTPAEIIALTNVIRQSEGLSPLHPNAQLSQAAQAKAAAMIATGSWSHDTPDATSWQFLDQAGYRYQIAGENLARNFVDSKQVIGAWLNSPSHRNNLLNPAYTQIGVAVQDGSGDTNTSLLVVQYLGTPLTNEATTQDVQFNATSTINFSSSINFLEFFLVLSTILTITMIIRYLKKLKKQKRNQSKSPQLKHWRN